jgi:hypothetical protein
MPGTRLPAGALLLLLLLPAAAGCLDWLGPPPGPGLDPRVVPEVWVVPALDLRLDHDYGNLRADGEVLAVPIRLFGQEAGAVYLGPVLSWRADEIFQLKVRENQQADVFVEAPLGQWAALRQRQGWQPAQASDLQTRGYADNASALARAARLLLPNDTAPAPGSWVVNGTVAARVSPTNFTLASEEGPFVFNRNTTNMVVVENVTVISWSELNRTLDTQQDALARIEVTNPDLLPGLRVSWTRSSVEARLATPAFREVDAPVDDDRASRIVSVTVSGVATMAMIKYLNFTRRDSFVEMRSANMTFRMGQDA